MARFDLNAFLRDPQAIARMVLPDEIFTMLTRSLCVPPDCVALSWESTGQPRLLAAGTTLEADGAARVLFARTSPFQIDYRFDSLVSQDGFDLSAEVGLVVRLLADRTDLASFAQAVLGSGHAATTLSLRGYCESCCRAAASAFAKARPIADLMSPGVSGFEALVDEHLKPVAFGAGLVLAGPSRIRLQSADFERSKEAQRLRQRHEARAVEEQRIREAASEARRQHMSELEASLGRLADMAEKHPGVSVPELIKAFAPEQRGGLYQALLSKSQAISRRQDIVLVAGDELLWISPSEPQKIAQRVSLVSDAGPLRSVRASSWEGRPVLLVGAKNGVHLLHSPQDPRKTFSFDWDRPLRGGVNSAIIVGERLYATHSEVGLIRWNLRGTEPGEFVAPELFAGCKSVRDVQVGESGRLFLAADQKVIALDAANDENPPQTVIFHSPVTSLCIADGVLFAGQQDGGIASCAANDLKMPSIVRHPSGSPVESIAHLSGSGVARLLVADRLPYLELLVLGDVASVKYVARQPMRWGLAAADWVVGVNDRRDQLVLWRIEDPAEPVAIVPIAKMCGHSMQDAAVVSDVFT